MLILRLAWLNLLDKHMTTGRINQVALVYTTRIEKEKKREELPPSPFLESTFDSLQFSRDSEENPRQTFVKELIMQN